MSSIPTTMDEMKGRRRKITIYGLFGKGEDPQAATRDASNKPTAGKEHEDPSSSPPRMARPPDLGERWVNEGGRKEGEGNMEGV